MTIQQNFRFDRMLISYINNITVPTCVLFEKIDMDPLKNADITQ